MNLLNSIKSPEELLKYMDENIHYGFVGKNGKRCYDMLSKDWNDWYQQCFVQNGEELIESKTGTCWDQVELERLWFENSKYKIYTFFMWFEVERQNNLPTHTFLIYENNNKYYWFEHAFELHKGIHEFSSLNEAIEYVKNKQIEYTKLNNNLSAEDINALVIYEYDKPGSHLGVDDYLEHVTQKRYISSKSI